VISCLVPILKTFLIGGWLSIPLRFMPRHPPDLRLFSSLRAFHTGPCLIRSLRSIEFRLRFAQAAPAGGSFADFYLLKGFSNLISSCISRDGEKVAHSTAFHAQPVARALFISVPAHAPCQPVPPSLTLLHFIPQTFAHPDPAVDAS